MVLLKLAYAAQSCLGDAPTFLFSHVIESASVVKAFMANNPTTWPVMETIAVRHPAEYVAKPDEVQCQLYKVFSLFLEKAKDVQAVMCHQSVESLDLPSCRSRCF